MAGDEAKFDQEVTGPPGKVKRGGVREFKIGGHPVLLMIVPLKAHEGALWGPAKNQRVHGNVLLVALAPRVHNVDTIEGDGSVDGIEISNRGLLEAHWGAGGKEPSVLGGRGVKI